MTDIDKIKENFVNYQLRNRLLSHPEVIDAQIVRIVNNETRRFEPCIKVFLLNGRELFLPYCQDAFDLLMVAIDEEKRRLELEDSRQEQLGRIEKRKILAGEGTCQCKCKHCGKPKR